MSSVCSMPRRTSLAFRMRPLTVLSTRTSRTCPTNGSRASLRRLFSHRAEAAQALRRSHRAGRLGPGGSELMEVEAGRALYRIHAEGLLTDEELGSRIAELQAIVAAVDRVPITKLVLNRAGGPLAGILKTLDAIHLVTAQLWSEYNGEAIVLLTHDRQLATVARASGLQVHPWPLGA